MSYLETLFNIENKIIILTGGGGVLAGEMAKGFLEAGAKVVLLDIKEENLTKKIASIGRNGNGLAGIQCDVMDQKSMHRAHQEVLDRFKRIDVLVNAAGGNKADATISLDQGIYPGYSFFGRMRNLAELRGMEVGIRRELELE